MIRLAEEKDLPRIVELGSMSLKDGPYAGIIQDVPEQSNKFAANMLANGKVLLAEENGVVVGLLGFVISDHHFSGQRYAAELMWYIQQGYRAMRSWTESHAIDLLKEAEKLAKEAGALDFVFTAPNDHIAALYRRVGYQQLEVTYRKVL